MTEKKTFASAEELFAHLRSLEIEPKALPELTDGEYLHFEYVQWNSIEDGGYYSNMVDLANTRDEAMTKLRELISSEDVYAVHVRRYPQPDKGVHAYDETQQLPRYQSVAYTEKLRADRLDRALRETETAKNDLETGYDQIVSGLEDTEKALRNVIETLMDSMRRVDRQLRRDVNNCEYSEPGELLNLMFGVGIVPDEGWERRMLTKAREDVRRKRKHREAVELAQRTGIWPLPPFEHGGATDRRKCACGQTWHKDEVPEWHNGLECQKPTHEQQVFHARKTTVWPPARPREGADPLSVFCACGQEWERGKVPSRHNGLECQPEKCDTAFNGGPCAGEKGHDGDCSPHPGDFGKCMEEGCSHLEERHVKMLPEEGGHTFCTECGTSGYQHDFKPLKEG